MHMIAYEEPVIRPPSEADSLILQATIGCSHNRCAFCVTYKDKQFRARPSAELFAEIDWAGREMPGITKVFLGDGDAFVLSTDRLLAMLDRLYKRIPTLRRVTAYACPGNFKNKSIEDLKVIRKAGLTMLYVGLESGDDEVLKRIDKGVTAAEMAALCEKPTEAGFKLFVTTVLGLGGPSLSSRHAVNTAKLLDAINPRFAAALTLMLVPEKSDYARAYGDPEWRLLEPEEALLECRTLIENIESKGIIFHANHASNYLPIKGVLQKDKARMLQAIDDAMKDPNRWVPEYWRAL